MTLTTAQRIAALEATAKNHETRIKALEIVPAPAPAPVPTPAPTPATPPATARRFAAPVTTQTVTVPASIDATGTTDVGDALFAFIASVPDGSVVTFPANGTYRLTWLLPIWRRHNLVIEGNGSKLIAGRAIPDYSLLSLYNSGDIAIRNLNFVGGNPYPGRLTSGSEDRAHAISIHHDDGQPSRIEIANCTSRNTWGDFLEIGGETWPDSIWMHDNDIIDAGRSGWSILAARNVWIERNRIGNCGLQHHNIEPWEARGGADNVHVLDNVSYGRFGYQVSGTGNFAVWFAANGNPLASISNIEVARNRVEQQVMQTEVTVGRRRSIVITDNTSLVAGSPLYGAGGVIDLAHVDGLTILRNVQPLTSGALVSVVDCTNVVR